MFNAFFRFSPYFQNVFAIRGSYSFNSLCNTHYDFYRVPINLNYGKILEQSNYKYIYSKVM